MLASTDHLALVQNEDVICMANGGNALCHDHGGDAAASLGKIFAQAAVAVPGIVTVVTKKELSRNEAVFRDNGELAREIRERIVEAVSGEVKMPTLRLPATFEKSFKRTEDAALWLDRLLSVGIEAWHPCEKILGKDAHTVVSKIYTIDDFIKCI